MNNDRYVRDVVLLVAISTLCVLGIHSCLPGTSKKGSQSEGGSGSVGVTVPLHAYMAGAQPAPVGVHFTLASGSYELAHPCWETLRFIEQTTYGYSSVHAPTYPVRAGDQCYLDTAPDETTLRVIWVEEGSSDPVALVRIEHWEHPWMDASGSCGKGSLRRDAPETLHLSAECPTGAVLLVPLSAIDAAKHASEDAVKEMRKQRDDEIAAQLGRAKQRLDEVRKNRPYLF